jgi:phospholipid-binding lipoprotein MlaA
MAVDKENDLSLDKDTYEGIKRDELDPYLFIRDAYAQRRQAQIAK